MIQQNEVINSRIKALQNEIQIESSNYLKAVVIHKDYAEARQSKQRITTLQIELNKYFSANGYNAA
jgi:RecA/RadA recombinase